MTNTNKDIYFYLNRNISNQNEEGTIFITIKLEKDGKRLYEMLKADTYPTNNDLDFAKEFIISIEEWKSMGDDSRTGWAIKNKKEKVWSVLSQAVKNIHNYEKTIKILSQLTGFKTKMSSAILRFFEPNSFGVVDWRNNAIFKIMTKANYDIGKTIFYANKVTKSSAHIGFDEITPQRGKDIQQFYDTLKNKYNLRSADIDMSIFEMSLDIWPIYKSYSYYDDFEFSY